MQSGIDDNNDARRYILNSAVVTLAATTSSSVTHFSSNMCYMIFLNITIIPLEKGLLHMPGEVRLVGIGYHGDVVEALILQLWSEVYIQL